MEDLVHVMRAALVDIRMKRQTIALVGPEEIYLSEAVRRVAEVIGKQPLMIRMPICFHKLLASFFEWTMRVPLVSLAQVRILSEGIVEAASPVVPLPYDLVPTRRFTNEQIRSGLPQAGPFCAGESAFVLLSHKMHKKSELRCNLCEWFASRSSAVVLVA